MDCHRLRLLWQLLIIVKGGVLSSYASTVNKGINPRKIDYTSGVTHDGSAYIEVPIEVPKAPFGFSPDLSFVYSSRAGRTDAGYGWILSGISSITRIAKSVYYNSSPVATNSTYTDAFALDGMKLIQTSVTSTEVNYVSEEGDVKVIGYRKTIDYKSTISHFKVMYPDGKVAIYGFSNETVVLSSYPVTQIIDVLGIATTFTYDIHSHNGNHYRITGVQYGLNKEYQIEVKYRGCGTVGGYDEYIGGYRYRREALIQYVNVKYNSNLLKTYTLSHSGTETRSLQSIALSNGSSSINTLNFTYGDSSQSSVFKSNGTAQMLYYYNYTDPAAIRVVRGKFDYGSQFDGIITLPNKIPYLEYYKHATTFRHSENYIYSQYNGEEEIMVSTGLNGEFSMPNPKIKTGAGFVDVFCANLDQFEEEEIIKVNNYVDGNYDRLVFTVYTPNLYTGLTRKYSRPFDFSTLLDHRGKKSVTPKTFYTGDFNGDGKTEILVIFSANGMGKGNVTKVCLFDLETNKILYDYPLLIPSIF